MQRRTLAVIALLALLTGGCASVFSALGKTPQRTADAFGDPVRREHLKTQIGLELSTVGVGITCTLFVPFPFSLAVCPLVALAYNFISYEYVLEPISKDRVKQGLPSLVGPYWERGPQDGEVFVHP